MLSLEFVSTRQWFSLRTVVVGLAMALPALATEPQAVELVDSRQDGQMQKVQVTFKVQGKLRTEQRSETKIPDVPLQAQSRLTYAEKFLRCTSQPGVTTRTVVAARDYEKAEANIQVADQRDDTQLKPHEKVILADGSAYALTSMGVPLSREEVEMLDVPGSSINAYRLLPNAPVTTGETWAHSADDMAAVFNLDEVIVNEVRSRLVDVERGLARMQIGGTITGNVHGAATELKVSGDYRYDLQWKRINWVQLVIEENREASPIRPGFNVKAELRMLVAPLKESSTLAAVDTPKALKITDNKHRFLRFESLPARYRLILDANWHVVDERTTSTSLRLVDKGDIVAQANIRRLKRLEKGKTLGLEEFQSDIQKALGDRFGQFESAKKSQRHDGYEVLRVAAMGTDAEIPVRWIYYHLANGIGDRIAFVFTMETKAIESFGKYDHAMIDSIQLLPIDESPKSEVEQARVPASSRR